MSESLSVGVDAPRKHTRSRAGCVRCRRRRQKCNQEKPSCGRCLAAGSPCKYEIKLNWGGRPFQKSSFGQCLGNVERLDDTRGGSGFVYALAKPSKKKDQPSPIERSPSTTSAVLLESKYEPTHIESLQNTTIDIITGSEVVHTHRPGFDSAEFINPSTLCTPGIIYTTIPPSLDQHSSLPPMVRYLFQFYLTETIRLTVPSTYARTEICRFLVPLSLQQPCLLYAIMAFASIHLKAVGGLSENAETVYNTLQEKSIQHLRPQLESSDPIARVASLATARTLCQAQIYGGKSSWRVHLDEARSILQSSDFRNQPLGGFSSGSTMEFLSSWYNNAEALAALTPAGLLRGQLEVSCLSNGPLYFDVYGGVMSDLPDLFREVGALVKERRHQADLSIHHSILSERDIAAESNALVQEIHFRLERDTVQNLCLSPQILALSANELQDYAMSNACFLYTALLHLHCGVQRLPPSSPEAQFCVEKIITCARNMNIASGSSPMVLLVSPLFTAGLCAIGLARESVESALKDIGQWMKTPHLLKTLDLLKKIWQRLEAGSEDNVWPWFESVNLDFLPY